MRSFACRCLFLFCCVRLSGAQDATTGAISGIVRDAQGTPIANAILSIDQRTLQSSQSGRFSFFGVAPGIYQLGLQAIGFDGEIISPINVTLGQTTQLSLVMRIATVNTVINVDANHLPSSAIDATTSSLNLTIAPSSLSALPLEGRRWQSFALLAPTVTAVDLEQNRITFGGIATTQNSTLLDNFDDTQNFLATPRGGNRAAFRVPQSGVHEFRIHASDYGASMGHAAGGVLSTVTSRGGATLHASAFFQYRGNLFTTQDPLAIATRYNNGSPIHFFVRPNDIRQQWGGHIGGPAYFGRLFYSIAFEQQARSFPAYSSPSNPSFFSLTATQTALLQTRGVTLAQIRTALSYLDSLSGQVDRHANTFALLPRIDLDLSPRNSVAVVWNHARHTSPAGVRTRAVVPRAITSFGDDTVHADDINARWTSAITDMLRNEAGIGYATDLETQTAQQPLPQEPHSGPNGFSPQVSLQGEFTLGKPATLGRRRYPDEQRLQIFDTLSWSGHQSLLQTGFSLSHIREHIDTLQNEEGSYTYSSGSTNGRAGGLVDWITDATFASTAYPNGACPSIYATTHLFCFSSYTQSFGHTVTDFATQDLAAFLQQHWQPSRSITIDAGLRYELTSLPSTQQPNAALDALFGNFARTSTFPSDTNNLAPRAAIAWSPGHQHRTAIRLSVGVHFGRIPGATVWSALARTAEPQTTYSIRLTPRTVVDGNCASFGTNFGYPATYACMPQGTVMHTTSAVLFSRGFQLPMVERAELSIEHQVGANIFSIAYLGTSARQLPNSTDINIAHTNQSAAFRVVRNDAFGPPGVRNGDTFSLPLYIARISSDFGPVTALISNASASSHALVLSARRPLRRGLALHAAWTYSKLLDYGQDHAALPNMNGQFDPFNVRYDRAASDLDRRQHILADGVWQPTFSGARFTRALFNQWSLASTFTTTTGRPYSYLITGGTEISGGRESINGSGGLRYLPSVGRNTLHLPWQYTLSLRLSRGFRITHDLRARLYTDVFNVLNHTSITQVQQRAFLVGATTNGITALNYQDAATIAAEGLNTQPFGAGTQSGNSLVRQRSVQFGLHIDF